MAEDVYKKQNKQKHAHAALLFRVRSQRVCNIISVSFAFISKVLVSSSLYISFVELLTVYAINAAIIAPHYYYSCYLYSTVQYSTVQLPVYSSRVAVAIIYGYYYRMGNLFVSVDTAVA